VTAVAYRFAAAAASHNRQDFPVTVVMRQDGFMESNTDDVREHPDPADPNREAGQSAQDPTVRTGEAPVSDESAPPRDDPKVPAASETWVEGQPTSDADYGSDDKTTE
jgi:hypothetical protein